MNLDEMKKQAFEYVQENWNGQEYNAIRENGFVVFDTNLNIVGGCLELYSERYEPNMMFMSLKTGDFLVAIGGDAYNGAKNIKSLNSLDPDDDEVIIIPTIDAIHFVQVLAQRIFFFSYLKFLKTYGLFFAESLWAKVNPVDKAGENLAGNAKLAERCPSMVFLVLSIEKIYRSLAIVHIDCKKTKAFF